MMGYLKQSTASQEICLGPFILKTDGSAATGLTIANTDIVTWKEGGTTLGAKNSGGATHISGGIYYATLDATDTDTLGKLSLFIAPATAIPLRFDFEVLPAVVYDSMILGTDLLQADLQQIAGAAVNAATAQVGVNVVNWKGSAAAAMTGDAYERLGAAGAGLTAIPWNAAWDAEVQSECADALAAYDPPTNAEMEARTLVAASYFDPAADTVAHVTLVDTCTTNTDMIAAAPTAAANADAIWDELLSGHTTSGTAGLALSTASSGGVDPAVLADAIWDEIMSGHTSAGSAGAFLALLNTYLDATVSSRLATSGYTAPPTAAAVRQEIDSNSTQLAAILTDTGTTLDTKINTIDAIIDNIHDTDLPAVKADTAAIAVVVDAIPTLSEIEASTVLAKEATVGEVKNLVGHYAISSPVFDADGNMTSCTITTPGDTYTVTATYDVDKNLASYEVTP